MKAGERGINHLVQILKADMQANMSQMGVENLVRLTEYLLTEKSSCTFCHQRETRRVSG